MDFYDKIVIFKKTNKKTNSDLGKIIGMTPDQFRMAIKRKSLSELEKREIENMFEYDHVYPKSKFGSGGESENIVISKMVINKPNEPDFVKEPIQQLNEAKTKYYTNESVMYVPLVNQYAYAGYLSGYGDPEYVEDLPKIPFVADKEYKGDYLCFEAKGDSMDDGTDEAIKERDILLCRNVKKDYWKSKLHINKWDFVIVHKEIGIVTKRIVKHDVENGIITLHSLNDYYDDFEVHLKDVSQILNIVDIQRKKNRR